MNEIENTLAELIGAVDALNAVAAAELRPVVQAADRRRNAPAPGSKLRWVFDQMRLAEGVTNKAICAFTGATGSYAIDGRNMAARFGLVFRQERDGRQMRYWLEDPAELPEVLLDDATIERHEREELAQAA